MGVLAALTDRRDAGTSAIVAAIGLLVGAGAIAFAFRQASEPPSRSEASASLASVLARLDPRFDPCRWKTEHLVALIGSMALGVLVCLVFSASHIGFSEAWRVSAWDASILTWDVILALLWTLFGALVAGGGVYVIQMLRR
jgi:hypothetical protein